MTAPVSQVLSEAADLLEKPGAWGQGFDVRCSQPPYCLGFAVEKVGGSLEDYMPALRKVLPVYGIGDVPRWNDAPGRTQAEVVAKLREAAALAKEQGR